MALVFEERLPLFFVQRSRSRRSWNERSRLLRRSREGSRLRQDSQDFRDTILQPENRTVYLLGNNATITYFFLHPILWYLEMFYYLILFTWEYLHFWHLTLSGFGQFGNNLSASATSSDRTWSTVFSTFSAPKLTEVWKTTDVESVFTFRLTLSRDTNRKMDFGSEMYRAEALFSSFTESLLFES